jgi:hypothetical protein
MTAQPFLDDIGGAAGDNIDTPAGLGVDEHGLLAEGLVRPAGDRAAHPADAHRTWTRRRRRKRPPAVRS